MSEELLGHTRATALMVILELIAPRVRNELNFSQTLIILTLLPNIQTPALLTPA